MARFEDTAPSARGDLEFSLPPSLKSKSPLAVLAQLRLQTAKASKGKSLSVQTSIRVFEGKQWDGVVPSGLPHDYDGHNQNSFKNQEFSCEEAGNLRKQVEALASLQDASFRSTHSPARPKTASLTSKSTSMDVLDPNEWERIGRQVQAAPRPASAQPRKSTVHSISKVEDDRRHLLRQKVEDRKHPESFHDSHIAPQGAIIRSLHGHAFAADEMHPPSLASCNTHAGSSSAAGSPAAAPRRRPCTPRRSRPAGPSPRTPAPPRRCRCRCRPATPAAAPP
jgi:hypothetical protein